MEGTMKGFVLTPRETVDEMVELLFRGRSPKPGDRVLDPGCGTGEFIDGIIRWCQHRRLALPRITGVESDGRHLPTLHEKYKLVSKVRVHHADFLLDGHETYDFIVGNPPYVAITSLSEDEKTLYREHYATARGRFDLYLLFFEQALRSLAPRGRLVFITPEKYLYVDTAGPLRDLLARHRIEEIRLVHEDTFGELVTYPTITVLNNSPPGRTDVIHRDGTRTAVSLPSGRNSWLPLLEGGISRSAVVTLGHVCLRISCGVATGADSVFVRSVSGLDSSLRHFARPTIAGRELRWATTDLSHHFAMLMPYDDNGRLLPFERLGALGRYLMEQNVRRRLLARTCVRRKPWYAFHETPVLRDILRPKILCKDISERPEFWVDWSGEIVPRHSVYYMVPLKATAIRVITAYLRSSSAHEWFAQNCQRAAKGFLRLQSHVLRQLPLPDDVARVATGEQKLSKAGSRELQTQMSLV